MDEQIAVLWELQKADLTILEIDKKLADLPKKRETIDRQVRALEEEMQLVVDARDKVRQDKEHRESEIEQEEQKIKSVEARLSHIRNQKDYQDVRRKLDLARKSNKMREDDVIKKMEELEKLNGEAEAAVANFEAQKVKLLEGASVFENEEADLRKERTDALEVREKIAEKLKGEIIKKYETLRKGCRGVGVSLARNEACEGCFMNLPPQLYNMIIKGDKLYQCPFCQRFLVHMPEKSEG